MGMWPLQMECSLSEYSVASPATGLHQESPVPQNQAESNALTKLMAQTRLCTCVAGVHLRCWCALVLPVCTCAAGLHAVRRYFVIQGSISLQHWQVGTPWLLLGLLQQLRLWLLLLPG